MPGQTGQNGALRVSPMDPRGRPISPAVLSAAEEVGRRAILHAERLLVDPALAADLLEEAAATVSRALTKNTCERPVQDLESYLFRAFLRRWFWKIAEAEAPALYLTVYRGLHEEDGLHHWTRSRTRRTEVDGNGLD